MKVTINTFNRRLQKEKKKSFASHLAQDLKPENKKNICFVSKLKFEFYAFQQQHDKNQPTLSQRRNMKQFNLLKENCKISTTKKFKQDIPHQIPGKLTYAFSQGNPDRSKHQNNPEIFYEDKLMSSINELKISKPHNSNQSTKANSRQKSFASSMESSMHCCKNGKTDREEAYIRIVDKQPVSTSVGTKGIKKQRKISKIMSPQISKITRIIMLDWLFQVSGEIELPKQALYNAIDYVDKYVAETEVKKQNYQKLGLACLFLATKLEMSSHPQIQTFLQAMDNQLDKEILIETERKIVNTLKFRLNPPTLYQYMTLALLTLKTFKSEYKNIGWLNELPVVEKDDSLWKKIFWILDGVSMEGVMVHKYGKSDICLAIMYISILAELDAKASLQQQERSVFWEKIRLESTIHSETQFMQNQRPQESGRNNYYQKIRLSFECFFRYATISNRSLHDLDHCLNDLKKWRTNKCNCDEYQGYEYHEELKHIALEKQPKKE